MNPTRKELFEKMVIISKKSENLTKSVQKSPTSYNLKYIEYNKQTKDMVDAIIKSNLEQLIYVSPELMTKEMLDRFIEEIGTKYISPHRVPQHLHTSEMAIEWINDGFYDNIRKDLVTRELLMSLVEKHPRCIMANHDILDEELVSIALSKDPTVIVNCVLDEKWFTDARVDACVEKLPGSMWSFVKYRTEERLTKLIEKGNGLQTVLEEEEYSQKYVNLAVAHNIGETKITDIPAIFLTDEICLYYAKRSIKGETRGHKFMEALPDSIISEFEDYVKQHGYV